jgi:hypothetical protein
MQRNKLHLNGKSHDTMFVEIKNTKLKMVYEAYNAVERFSVYVFDGLQLNLILTMADLGVESNSSAYNIFSPIEREKRADLMFSKGHKTMELLLKK